MATTYTGPIRVESCETDDDGHLTISITYGVRGELNDGPLTALLTTGLPQYGNYYEFFDEDHQWAYCTPKASVKVRDAKDGEKPRHFEVTKTFTTKPLKRCGDQKFEDPMTEPPKISGGSVKQSEEATLDRFGKPILTSSLEQIRGKEVEFDANRDTIKIEMNVPSFAYVAMAILMRNCVNNFPLWGLPPRCIKLSGTPWSKEYYGLCYTYYKLTLEFEVWTVSDPVTGLTTSGFDREILDEGTKALNGEFDKTTGEYVLLDINGDPPNPKDPTHFKKFTDRQGNASRVILNGAGIPAEVICGTNSRFISLQNTNLGNSLGDTSYWQPLYNPDLTPIEWFSGEKYPAGTVVIDEDLQQFVAIKDSLQGEIPGNDLTVWRYLPSGVTVIGTYSAATTYSLGDLAAAPADTAPGRILVQRYNSANFLLLGIPAIL